MGKLFFFWSERNSKECQAILPGQLFHFTATGRFSCQNCSSQSMFSLTLRLGEYLNLPMRFCKTEISMNYNFRCRTGPCFCLIHNHKKALLLVCIWFILAFPSQIENLNHESESCNDSYSVAVIQIITIHSQ